MDQQLVHLILGLCLLALLQLACLIAWGLFTGDLHLDVFVAGLKKARSKRNDS